MLKWAICKLTASSHRPEASCIQLQLSSALGIVAVAVAVASVHLTREGELYRPETPGSGKPGGVYTML